MNDVDLPLAPRTSGIFAHLDREWAQLCATSAVRAAVADWLVADGVASDVAALTESTVRDLGPEHIVAALKPRGTPAVVDAVLRLLLVRAGGDGRAAELAGRIVVQTMLPAAVRIARSQVRPFGGRGLDDLGHMVITALYELARSGRIHRRPGRPAANLALDALNRLCRDLAAEREELGEDLAAYEGLPATTPDPATCALYAAAHTAATAAHLEPDARCVEETSTARLELLELVVDAIERGVLSLADGQSIAWHYRAEPLSDSIAATRTGSTATAWQRRRSRAVARLKTAA